MALRRGAIDVSRMLASNYKTYILTLSNNLSETNFYGCTPIYAYTLSLQFANKRLLWRLKPFFRFLDEILLFFRLFARNYDFILINGFGSSSLWFLCKSYLRAKYATVAFFKGIS